MKKTYALLGGRAVCAAAALMVASAAHRAHALPPQRDAAGRPMIDQCATERLWEAKRAALGAAAGPTGAMIPACGIGNCDDPVVRDAADTSTVKQVRVVVHVMRSLGGAAPDGVDQAVVDAQIQHLNEAYSGLQDGSASPANVQFVLQETQYHDDWRYYCIAPYTPIGVRWQNQLAQMKQTYAVTPDQALNVFVSCQDPSSYGTLLGIGTFPWDPAALTAAGGVWVNSLAFGGTDDTLVHEVGHNLAQPADRGRSSL